MKKPPWSGMVEKADLVKRMEDLVEHVKKAFEGLQDCDKCNKLARQKLMDTVAQTSETIKGVTEGSDGGPVECISPCHVADVNSLIFKRDFQRMFVFRHCQHLDTKWK